MTRFPALLALALVLALPAAAQERFPDKPVRFIVPFPPGGGTDSLARILGAKLAANQQVLIENRAGAQGNIGTAAGSPTCRARSSPATPSSPTSSSGTA